MYVVSHSNRVELYGIDGVYRMEWNGVVLSLVLFVGNVCVCVCVSTEILHIRKILYVITCI